MFFEKIQIFKITILYIIDHCIFNSRCCFSYLGKENAKTLKSLSLFRIFVLSNGHSNEMLLSNPCYWTVKICIFHSVTTCNSCRWTETFYTSEKNGHFVDINGRVVYAMRSINCGQSAMSRFCSTIINMPPPVGSRPFRGQTKALLRAAKNVAEQTIKNAAQEVYNSKTKVVKTLWKLRFHAMELGKGGDTPRCMVVLLSFPWKMEKYWM